MLKEGSKRNEVASVKDLWRKFSGLCVEPRGPFAMVVLHAILKKAALLVVLEGVS